MDSGLENFSVICGELCNLLYVKDYEKGKLNSLIDELNAKPYKVSFFVTKHDATSLVTALCLNVRPVDEFLAAKTSHLVNSILTKQKLQFSADYLWKVISWHIQCLRKCSDIILPDILHNMQCILQSNPGAGAKFMDELIGTQGILINIIQSDKKNVLSTQNPLQITLIAFKCICSLTSIMEDSKTSEQTTIQPEVKKHMVEVIISYLMKTSIKLQDEFLYCKVIISALRVLSQLFYNEWNISIPMPEVIGICLHFVRYGLISLNNKPERIMPGQQTIAAVTVTHNTKGGKKQKLRKQRNNALEGLKKEIPVSDHSLMKDIGSFENNSAYRPATQNYLEPQRTKNMWALTSDSEVSDVEGSREAKLIALKSRVRQSASNLFLVVLKVTEKKDIIGFWWALLPDCPDVSNWSSDNGAKKTLAYCAYADPIANSRAGILSVILSLLSGSRMYLSQAETSKKDNTSFIPFSVSLGYIITCMHKVLVTILDSERSHAVMIVALKCCAALVQATPYHKMREGLITDLVRSTRKFLVHRDVALQVGALITMGCVLSVDPKVNDILKAIERDSITSKPVELSSKCKTEAIGNDCDDFEEGYSDDEMFTAVDHCPVTSDSKISAKDGHYFKSWILDICFKNMGWMFKGNEIMKCKPSAIPIVLESLQVLSAIAFHHLSELLQSHLTLLADILSETLQHDHLDVILHSCRTVSIIGDAISKLEQTNEAPPLNQCVYMWEKFLKPLSTILQYQESPAAKAVACDCIANIGEKPFKELPRRSQVLCCTLVVGSSSDEEPAVRAAAVRALAMLVTYRTLRDDICFVSDCGESVLRALGESSLVVRTKAAWALGTLSDALVLNMEEPEHDEIDDDLMLRLLKVSVQCAADNDKVKMSAMRGLGNLLRLIKEEHLVRNPQMKSLCEAAIEKLLDCATKGTNMKVRWNACYAMGNAMKNENLFTCFSGWQRLVFPRLCALSAECKNLKVRINASVALRSPSSREFYAEQWATVWRGTMAAMEAAADVDDFTEYKHRDNLIEQLCVTLAHLCCLLKQEDLADILDPLVFHHDCAKSLYSQLCHKLLPESASCLTILQAAKHVTVDLTASNSTQSQSLGLLQDIFIWDI